MANENPFKVGDKITKYNGKKPLTVTSISGNYVYATYDHSGSSVSNYYNDFKYYEEEVNNMTKDALYRIKLDGNVEVYGIHIGTDSQGRYLMEEKGTGKIHIVAKGDFEEVLPYTFSVRMNGREQHFQGEMGKVKKGDILLYTAGGADNFAFAVVKNIDTKNKGAKVWEGVRLVTEPM